MANLIDKFMRNAPIIALPLMFILLPFIWVGAMIWALIEGIWQGKRNNLYWDHLTGEYLPAEEVERNHRYHYGLDDWTENPDDPDWDYKEEQ